MIKVLEGVGAAPEKGSAYLQGEVTGVVPAEERAVVSAMIGLAVLTLRRRCIAHLAPALSRVSAFVPWAQWCEYRGAVSCVGTGGEI